MRRGDRSRDVIFRARRRSPPPPSFRDITEPYLFGAGGRALATSSHSSPRGLIFLFHRSRTETAARRAIESPRRGDFHRSFRDQSYVTEIVSRRDRLSATCPRPAKRGRSTGLSSSIIGVTVPLPNFKYAHTSQLVTTNYLGRLLALEEAI